jgi:hypothetical protein
MLALVGTVISRSASGSVLLRDGDKVLGTHRFWVLGTHKSDPSSSEVDRPGSDGAVESVAAKAELGCRSALPGHPQPRSPTALAVGLALHGIRSGYLSQECERFIVRCQLPGGAVGRRGSACR